MLFLAAIYIALAVAQTCYYPDGTTESADIPCNASATYSPCCGEDAWCLDNGLCLYSGVVSRGSCTDRTWGDSCTSYCADTTASTNYQGIALTICNTKTNSWACGINISTCVDNDADEIFTMQGGNNIILRDYQVADLNTSSKGAMRITPLTNFTASAVNDTSASTSTMTATVTATQSRSGRFTAADVAGAAIGTGIPLLAALLVSILVVFSMRRKIRQLEATQSSRMLQQPQAADTQPYDQYGYDPKVQFPPATGQSPYVDNPISEIGTEHRTHELASGDGSGRN